jgi:hypothetical protein
MAGLSNNQSKHVFRLPWAKMIIPVFRSVITCPPPRASMHFARLPDSQSKTKKKQKKKKKTQQNLPIEGEPLLCCV